MHCIQYVATRAANKEEAISKVKNYLEAAMGADDSYASWYDWFIVGGGRWSSDPDNYRDTAADVAVLGEPRFEEYLEKAAEYKKSDYVDILKYAREQVSNFEVMLREIEDMATGLEPMFQFSMRLYGLHQLYKMTGGDWGSYSYFYDIESGCTHPEPMRESYSKGKRDWFIVPVDFHF